MARPLGSALQPVLGFTNWSLSALKPASKAPILPAQGERLRCYRSLTCSLHQPYLIWRALRV